MYFFCWLCAKSVHCSSSSTIGGSTSNYSLSQALPPAPPSLVVGSSLSQSNPSGETDNVFILIVWLVCTVELAGMCPHQRRYDMRASIRLIASAITLSVGG